MTRFRFITLIMVLVSVHIAVAQKTKQHKLATYNGPYDEGTATYTYYEDPTTGEKIRQGKFSYEASRSLLKILTTGSYTAGKKDGKWIYTQSGSGYLDASTYTSASSMITGSYRDSFPIDRWTIEESGMVKEGQIQTVTTAKGSATFVPTGWKFSADTQLGGDFSYSETNSDGYSSTSVTGQFAPQGYMDGRWAITYYVGDEYNEEIREYDNGFLLGVTVRGVTSGKLYVRLRNDSTIARLERIRQFGDSADYRIKKVSPPQLWWVETTANGIQNLKTGDKIIQKAKTRFCGNDSQIGMYCLAFYIRDLEPNVLH